MLRVPDAFPLGDFYGAAQTVKVYADPGTQVLCLLTHVDITQSIAGSCSFSGSMDSRP
jgi:hypothetical protein